MFVQIILSSVWVAERPSFGKELHTRLTTCSPCVLTICNFSYFRSGFEGRIWVLIAPVPGNWLLVTFGITGVYIIFLSFTLKCVHDLHSEQNIFCIF